MMMNIYDGELSTLDKSVAVFDDVEVSLENIEGNSRYINEKVWQSWKTEDVPGMTLKSFVQTLRNAPEKSWSYATRRAINDELEGLNNTRIKSGLPPIGNAKAMKKELTKMAAQNRTRKRAMDSMSLSADHMAGADAPYFKDGVQVEMNGTMSPRSKRNLIPFTRSKWTSSEPKPKPKKKPEVSKSQTRL